MLVVGLVAAIAANPTIDGTVIPTIRREIAAACGSSPQVSVSWGDFGDDKGGADALAASGLSFVSSAFETVCKDRALRAEARRQVLKVVLRQAYGATDPILYISKGTLYIEYLWRAGDPAPSAAFVASELADRLRGGEPEAP